VNTQEYIQSGIIESYVLGMASSAEAAELEQLCLQYPEIKQALTDFEISFRSQFIGQSGCATTSFKTTNFCFFEVGIRDS
jgi:hypothetical protein